jgi:hypothetical protein
MSLPAGLQQPIDGIADDISFTSAAEKLAVSEATLCQLILMGHLTRVGERTVARGEVDDLVKQQLKRAERTRRAKDRLPRTTEHALWLLADWGGRGRVINLAASLEVSSQNVHAMITTAVSAGYVERASGKQPGYYRLTGDGWRYVQTHRTLI